MQISNDNETSEEEIMINVAILGYGTVGSGVFEILDTNKAYLTIHEGKFHQVKRMFEKANCTVTYLQRIEFGPLKLNDLPLGEFRALTQEELDALKG